MLLSKCLEMIVNMIHFATPESLRLGVAVLILSTRRDSRLQQKFLMTYVLKLVHGLKSFYELQQIPISSLVC